MSRAAGFLGGLAAALIGALTFYVWAGPALVDPSNIGWLAVGNGDPLTRALGWWYFRGEPWTIPPGATPLNGLEFKGSIALTDSLPLLAFPIKLLQPLLPPIQQYLGAWLLLCMVLQGVFGYLVARTLHANIAVSVLAAAFLCFAPAFLFFEVDHYTGSSPWVILAAFWLYARGGKRLWAWPLLLLIAAWIHSYLLAMIMAMWLASVVQRSRAGESQLRLLLELAVGIATMGIALWASGTFESSTAEAWGLGIYRLNLLSLIDPDAFSRVLADIPTGFGDYEGFAYLGLGMLGLLAIAILGLAMAPLGAAFRARWLPLTIAIILMVLFALSPIIAFGPIELVTLPIPAWMARLWSIFRATGRFVWPAYYLLIVVVVVLIGRRFHPAVALPLLIVALGVQIYDSMPGWTGFKAERQAYSTTWPTQFVSPIWDAMPSRYQRIREIPPWEKGKHWWQLSTLAYSRGMATDSVLLGRIDHRVWQEMDARAMAAVTTGSFDPGAVYYVGDELGRWAARQAGPGDLFGIIDHALIFARGGADLAAATGTTVTPYDATAPELAAGVAVVPTEQTPVLAGEWRDFRSGGAIAIRQYAGIQFRAPVGNGAVLRLWLAANTRAPGVPQHVSFGVNGHDAGALDIPDGETAVYDVPLTTHADGNFLVDLAITEAEGPFILHPGRDGAPVGLIVTQMELLSAAP